MNNAGNVNMEHGSIIHSNFSVLVPRILDMIIRAQNIPVNREYNFVFVKFSNILKLQINNMYD
jgi:hypothetical protein